jgi:hypothetical protein
MNTSFIKIHRIMAGAVLAAHREQAEDLGRQQQRTG